MRGLFDDLADADGLVAAVSGGPDSTALMILLSDWIQGQIRNGLAAPEILVIHVDHGLRAGSEAEAEIVGENAKELGFRFQSVHVGEAPPHANIQSWARTLRYRCLVDIARAQDFEFILTAHHRDDQAETFLLRLSRGSGLFGLGAMAPEVKMSGVRVVRPLLDLPKSDLLRVARERQMKLVDDPTNRDQSYDRVRIRDAMPALEAAGLSPVQLADTAGQLREISDALDAQISEVFSLHFQTDQFGVICGSADVVSDQAEFFGCRMLSRLIQAVGGRAYAPVQDKIRGLHKALTQSDKKSLKRTLGGVVVTVEGDRIVFAREWGRDGPADMFVTANQTRDWDGRFRIEVPMVSAPNTKIAALGHSDRSLLVNGNKPEALRTLPGLFCANRLVAVPNGVTVADAGNLDRLSVNCLVEERLQNPRSILL